MGGILSMIGQGISSGAGALSQFAGDAAVLQQKSDYEKQAAILADQLTTARETKLEAQRQTGALALETTRAGLQEGNAEKLAKVTSDLSVEANRKNALNAIDTLPQMQAAKDKIDAMHASDPTWIANQKALMDVNSTPEQRAAAAKYRAEASLATVQSSVLGETQAARVAMNRAIATGDPQAISEARSRLAVAEYSSHDEVQRAAALNQAATQSRLNLQSIQHDLDIAQGDPVKMSQPEGKAEVARLKAELAIANSDYSSVSAQALQAARNLPDFSSVTGNNKTPGNRPPITTFDPSAGQ